AVTTAPITRTATSETSPPSTRKRATSDIEPHPSRRWASRIALAGLAADALAAARFMARLRPLRADGASIAMVRRRCAGGRSRSVHPLRKASLSRVVVLKPRSVLRWRKHALPVIVFRFRRRCRQEMQAPKPAQGPLQRHDLGACGDPAAGAA